MDAALQDRRRIVVAIAVFVACPLYVLCGLTHVCMGGHMEHPPYPVLDYAIDASWVLLFVVSSVFCWKSNLHFRKTVFICVVLLLVSRMALGSGGGGLFALELPLLLVLFFAAVRSLFGRARDWRTAPPAEKKVHRARILRFWAIAAAVLVGGGFLVWAGIHIYRLARQAAAPRVQVSTVPFADDIVLEPGDACVFVLPNGKSVAVWCARNTGILSSFRGTGIDLGYGEKPFEHLKWEEIRLPEGGTTYGEYLSYIRSGGVLDGGGITPSEYILYVDPYRISLKEKDLNDRNLPITVSVRLATDKERRHGRAEREYYMQALSSANPKERLEAVLELGQLVSLGSIHAGDPVEIANAIRPLLKDPDPEVRKEALVRLHVMGDDEALLEMLTPRPPDEYLKPNWAWTIAGWADKASERVPKQVLSYFQTDDPALHEFALAFFSCYKIPYPAAQPYVERNLDSPSPAVRAAAASAIRFTCDPRQAAKLIYKALGDTSQPVLLEALRDASYFNDSVPIDRIIRLLGHESPEVRLGATRALDCCRDPAAIGPLLAATHDADPQVRASAAVSLGRIGEPKAYPRLMALLEDDSPQVRQSAINGLRWLGNKDAVPAILRLRDQDPDEHVRAMARRTVRELSGQ